MPRRPRRVTVRLKLLRQMTIPFQKQFVFFYFTKSLENSKFSSCLKLTNITTVFKKGRRASKNNYYRLVSVLPIFSEIFERLLSRQILEFFDSLNFNVVLERVMLLSTAYYWCSKFGKTLLTIIKLSVRH